MTVTNQVDQAAEKSKFFEALKENLSKLIESEEDFTEENLKRHLITATVEGLKNQILDEFGEVPLKPAYMVAMLTLTEEYIKVTFEEMGKVSLEAFSEDKLKVITRQFNLFSGSIKKTLYQLSKL